MLSIAVCDDKISDCCNIAKGIKDILEEEGIPFIIKQFNSSSALLNSTECFDIIFLDIIMDGINGMEAAQLLRNKSFNQVLIFISSSSKYVFEAYDVEAFWYLVKPVSKSRLKKVLIKAARKSFNNQDGFIIINKDRQNKKLLLKDIYYFEVKGRIIYAHGISGITAYYGQIGNLEKDLAGKGFSRCHKSFLVNLGHVDIYNRQEAVLDNGERVAIAKRRYNTFCKEILMYMKKAGGIG
ncbi:MAG: LytTR family DNA-binding domain-containing protein [Lachnospiraceae bacterium]